MKNTGIIITISFIIGIIIGYYARFYEHAFLYLLFSVIIIVLISAVLFRKYKYTYILVLPVFVIFGFIRIIDSARFTSYEVENISLNETETEISAVIYKLDGKYNNGYSFLAKSEYILKKDNKKILEEIGIKVYFSGNEKFSEGDKIKLYGRLIKPETLRNPGGFNENDYYRIKNIEYKMFSDNAVKTGEKTDIEIILRKFNKKVSQVYDNIFPKDEAALMKAMIVGDKTDLSFHTKDIFSRTGIYHIVAVSGLHIHILAFIVLFLAERIHKKYGKIFAIFFVIIYCVFTGLSVSAVRATIMFLIYIFGKLIYRESNVLNSLAVSCIFILCFQPLYLFDIGFQYSFSAVLSLAVFSKPVSKIFRKVFRQDIAEILSSAISVNFIPTSVVWFNFFGLPTMDIFANLIILPFLGIIVFIGFIVGIVGLFSINTASLFSGIPYIIMRIIEFIAEVFSDIPFSYISLGKPDIINILCYLSVVTVFVLFLYRHIDKKVFIVFTVIVIFTNIFYIKSEYQFKVTMLDVGQGDCFVFNYKDRCFIIDGGGEYEEKIGEDKGVSVLYPYLKYMGVDYIDSVFITHPDADHIKGIIEIMDYIDLGKIYVSNKADKTELYEILKQKAYLLNIEIYELCEGNELNFYNDVLIECVYPFKENTNEGNSGSLVLKINFKNTSFLFTGDINYECEKQIISKGNNISADVLKLAHHGSKYSSCEEFIDTVNPKLGIVSAGNFNRYGHPSKEVLNRFSHRNIDVLNTREKGAVEIYSDGDNIYYKTMK